MAKIHFDDGRGPICGARQKQALEAMLHVDDLHKVDMGLLRNVSCLRCVKKLREWGFALQNFAVLTENTLRSPNREVATNGNDT